MRKTMLWAAAMALVGLSSAARADGPVPPVMVGPVVIQGFEAEEMVDVLAHHRHHHYRAGDEMSWLIPSAPQGTLSPYMPAVSVNGVFITGREAEDMISKLSRMRHHGRYRAGMSLDWLGIPTAMVPMPPPMPVVMMVPPPMPVVMVAPPPMPVVMVPQAPVMMAAPPVIRAQPVEPNLSRTLIGVGAEANKDHASMNLSLAYESKHWGFNLNGAMTIHRTEDGQQTKIRLVDAHLTFAPIVGERGRIRIEAGAAMAEGLDGVFMFGPDVGLSGDIRILGPFGLFANGHATFWPYHRWDVYGGLFAKLWVFRLEAGWREMHMKADLKDGEVMCDKWSGPYVGMTLVF